MRTTDRECRETELRMECLEFQHFKGMTEDTEVIRDIGKGPKVGRESGENCVREAKRSAFQQ